MDRTERLLNLVLCLLSATGPVDRETIRRVVVGYDPNSSSAAFERMFERDKDELRAMGIPLETVSTTEGEVLGYRIPRDDYRLPPISFTGEQWALLGLAARAWSQASMGQQARTALRKLEGSGSGTDTGKPSEVIDWHSRPEAGEQWLAVLWQAIRLRQSVSYDYLGLRDREPAHRRVEPWSILGRHGGWYLIGHDLDRGSPRSFRLSRIVGDITVSAEAGTYTIPPHQPGEMLGSMIDDSEVIDAWIAIAPGSGGRLRMSAGSPQTPPEHVPAHAPESFDVVRLVDRSIETVSAEVTELGDHAYVLHPEDLRDRVVDGLRRVLETHEGHPDQGRDPR